MKIRLILSLLICWIPFAGFGQPDTLTMDEVLLKLPDSAFQYSHRLVREGTSFNRKERLKITQKSDSAIYRYSDRNDSLHYLWLNNTGENNLHIQYWKKKNHHIVIAVLEDQCDFVMCFQKCTFWEYDGSRFLPLQLDFHETPLSHFFESADLKKCGFLADKGCEEYYLVLEENHLKIKFQQEYLDPELMGEDGKYVCLDLEKSKLFSQEVSYEWNGKKFKLKILKTTQHEE